MKCPVCNTENAGNSSKCIECGFDQLNPMFLNAIDANHWEENVLLPAIEEHNRKKENSIDGSLAEVLCQKPLFYLVEADIADISLIAEYDSKGTAIRRGKFVKAIKVYRIILKDFCNRNNWRIHFIMGKINEALDYHIIFLIQHKNDYQAWHFYKEPEKITINDREITRAKCKASPWRSMNEFTQIPKGKDLDAVFDNLYKAID